MKFHLIPALLCFLGFSLQLSAQKEICKNIYVWDFTDEQGEQAPYARQIMQEVENALTETACTVLQRRNYGQITEQVENENAVQTLEGISGDLNEQLEAIQAETVLFGRVKIDFAGNIELHLSFEHLATKEILRSEFLLLRSEEAHNGQKRRSRIRTFIARCTGSEVAPGSTASPESVQGIPKGPIYAGLSGVAVLGCGLLIGGASKAAKAKRTYEDEIRPQYEGQVGPEDTAYLQEYETLDQRYRSGQWLMVGGAVILAGGGYLLVKKLLDINKQNATSRLEVQPSFQFAGPAAPQGMVAGMGIRYRF